VRQAVAEIGVSVATELDYEISRVNDGAKTADVIESRYYEG
jgi:hypothetical protein